MAAVLLAFGRFDAKVPLHLWARRYAVAISMQSAVLVVGQPWLFAACPPYWVDIGSILGLDWVDTGSILGLDWVDIWSILRPVAIALPLP